MKPQISRHSQNFGSREPRIFTQTISDRLMLLSSRTRFRSQSWKRPKKFQPGPRRKVPMNARSTQRMKNPKQKIVIAPLRSFSVK